jgi:hypothetical protein
MEKRIRKFKSFTELESSEKISDDTMKFYLTDMKKKHTYHLWIERNTDKFTIFLPGPGIQLTGRRDNLNSSGKLRDHDPGFVQSWIARCFDRLDRNLMEGKYESDDNLDTEQFKYEILPTQDGAVYRLAFDRNENVVSIVFPERELKFKPDEIYLAAPELPIIHAGTINSMVRERLLEEGVELPPTPYLGGVEATKKYDD